MAAQKKQTVEEAVLSQSLADIERASDRPMKAAAMDAEAAETLDPITHAHGLVTIGRGGEVSLADSESQPGILDTIREKQDMVTARASHQRLALTGNALLLAVDAAELDQSPQLARAHEGAPARGSASAWDEIRRQLGNPAGQVDLGISGWRPASELQAASVEAARLGNAAVRAFGGYDDGWLALDRIRRGGKQTVTVVHQNVAVGPGGQAVVAGAVRGRGTRGKGTGGGRKNGP